MRAYQTTKLRSGRGNIKPKPAAPASVSSSLLDEVTIRTTWQDPADLTKLTSYKIYKSVDGGSFTLRDTVTPVSYPSYATYDDGPLGVGTYQYRVTCVSTDNLESAATTATAVVVSSSTNPTTLQWNIPDAPYALPVSWVEGVGGSYDLSQFVDVPTGVTPVYTIVSGGGTGISVNSSTGLLTADNTVTANSYAVVVSLNGSSSRTFGFAVATVGFTAQPGYTVTPATTFTDGASITIAKPAGGLGTKSQAAPVSFDKVDSWLANGASSIPYTGISNGQEIPNGAAYPFNYNVGGVMNNTDGFKLDTSVYRTNRASSYRGDLTALNDRHVTFDGWNAFGTGAGFTRCYVRWYFKPDFTPTVIAANKFLRVWDSNGSNPQLRISWSYDVFGDATPGGSGLLAYNNTVPTVGQWNLMEEEVYVPANGVGTAKCWLNGTLINSLSGPLGFNWPLAGMIPRNFGMEPRGGSLDFAGLPDPIHIWISDVWADSTPQRIEIGNAATWAACTAREPCPASAWSDTQITATINLGAFSSVSGLYLYHVDSSNTATLVGAFQ